MANHAPIHIDDSVKARFWGYVPTRDPSQCWDWQGHITPSGYGNMKIKCQSRRANRIALVIAGHTPGPDEVADHTCRNKRCVNPAHLRFVSFRTNSIENSIGTSAINAAKTHCKNGHELRGANLKIEASGSRRCVPCAREYSKMKTQEYRAKARALRELGQRVE